MVVLPKIRNNICLTAHPLGCALQVQHQINFVKHRDPLDGPKRVLVIGSSNGYGLASRIVAAFGCGADSVGISYERPGSVTRPGTAGWYNEAALVERAAEAGLKAFSVNGDAFSDEMKQKVCGLIEHTIKVMGGEDWLLWIEALLDRGILADGFKTIAYSYLGPDLTCPIYREGTIGRAKLHLEGTVDTINTRLTNLNGMAVVSVNKALVTRASAVIPAVPLYISLLYRVMKSKGIHEGCIQQMYRLFHDYLCMPSPRPLDESGRIRLDDLEMREDVQREVRLLWERVETKNLASISDIRGFSDEFLMHHGFGVPGVDYDADVTLV